MADQPIQLCFSAFHFYPVHGGGQLRFLRYFDGLRKRGIHATVVTGTPQSSKSTSSAYAHEWQGYRIGCLIPTEPLNGTPVHRVRLPGDQGFRRRLVFNRELVRFCRRPSSRPDVLQLFQTLPHRSTWWLRQLKNSGIALAYAYTAPAKLPRSYPKRVLRLWRIRAVSRLIDCIIVSSSEMSRHARAMGFHGQIEVIPNGVDLKRFHPNRSDVQCRNLRKSLGMDDDSIMIATVGSLIPEKGADLLVEAWTPLARQFPHIHLVITGTRFDPDHPQNGPYQKKIAALVAASGAGDRIHLTGHISDIPAYFRASDIFVFPTAKEGMPNVVIEAMASGVPVVMTPFPTLPQEFGRQGSEYLLSDREPEALAAQMERLIRNPDIRMKLGRQGRSWMEKSMDLENTLDRYAALYRKLAKSAIRRHGATAGRRIVDE
jgi:glycosyltransferase involved in cell wall biosynthesis